MKSDDTTRSTTDVSQSGAMLEVSRVRALYRKVKSMSDEDRDNGPQEDPKKVDVDVTFKHAGPVPEWDKWWMRQPAAITSNPELAARAAYNVGMMLGLSIAHDNLVCRLIESQQKGVSIETLAKWIREPGGTWAVASDEPDEGT